VCLAIPGQVIEISGDQPLLARVEVAGVQRNVNIGLLEDGEVAPGDWLLIHVGFALSKIDEAQAQDQLRMLRALGEDQLAIDEVRGYSFADASGEPDEIRR
jgi:hydrogenase expression/formation protein HypC